MTALLFAISLAAYRRSRDARAGAISAALGLFAFKNIILTILYFRDDTPDLAVLMLTDALIAGLMLFGLVRK